MGLGFLSFYTACVRRAFSGWFGTVSGWAGTLSLLVGVALLFFDVPPFVSDLASKAEPAFFLPVFALSLVVRLFMAPYWLFHDERARRLECEKAAQPTLTVSLPDPPTLTSVSLAGSTSESISGIRQTIINRWEMDVVALICTNHGLREAEGCRARLLSVVRVTNGRVEDLGMVEAISLPWDKQDREGSHLVDIPASETKRIWLGGVRSRGHLWIFRDVKALPLDYQRLLGEPGTYRVLIQVDARDVPPQQIALEIFAAEGAPIEGGVQRGRIDVRVVAQASPRIAPDAWQGGAAPTSGAD